MNATRGLLNVINCVKTQLVITIAVVLDLDIDCRMTTTLVSVMFTVRLYIHNFIIELLYPCHRH